MSENEIYNSDIKNGTIEIESNNESIIKSSSNAIPAKNDDESKRNLYFKMGNKYLRISILL